MLLKKSMQITVELPDDLLSSFQMTPNDFAREMSVSAVVKWFELGEFSQSKASEILDVSRNEFLDILTRFEVSPFQLSVEELQNEIENV